MLDEELMQEVSKDLPNIPHVFISSQNETGLVQLKDMLWRELNPSIES
jgi:GTP-binding protein